MTLFKGDIQNMKQALKLQELVKERIKESDEEMKNNDIVYNKHNY